MAPPAAPMAAGAPPVPRPPGAPTAPRPAAPPVAGLPAATRPLAQNPAAPAPRVETGAPTVALQRPGPRPPGAPGAGTGPMVGGAPGMPKATVKLQPTQAMQRPSISAPPSAPVKRSAAADAEQFYEEKDPEAGLVPLSVICFVFAAVLMALQMFGTDKVMKDEAGAGSPILVPVENRAKWESRTADGKWVNNFTTPGKSELLAIP